MKTFQLFNAPCSSRNIYPLVILGFCVLTFSTAAQTIVNPGFEDELSEWAPIADGGMSAAAAEAAHSGAFGLRVTDQSGTKGSGLESLLTDANPGKKYEVSFWARTISGQGALAVSLRFLDDHKKGLQKKSPTVDARPSAEWQKFTVTGTAPEFTAALCVRVHSTALETGVFDVDDFEVRELP